MGLGPTISVPPWHFNKDRRNYIYFHQHHFNQTFDFPDVIYQGVDQFVIKISRSVDKSEGLLHACAALARQSIANRSDIAVNSSHPITAGNY